MKQKETQIWNPQGTTKNGPPRGMKVFLSQKTAINLAKSKSKKCFLGGEIKQKEIKSDETTHIYIINIPLIFFTD